jgi:hypothetical protein
MGLEKVFELFEPNTGISPVNSVTTSTQAKSVSQPNSKSVPRSNTSQSKSVSQSNTSQSKSVPQSNKESKANSNKESDKSPNAKSNKDSIKSWEHKFEKYKTKDIRTNIITEKASLYAKRDIDKLLEAGHISSIVKFKKPIEIAKANLDAKKIIIAGFLNFNKDKPLFWKLFLLLSAGKSTNKLDAKQDIKTNTKSNTKSTDKPDTKPNTKLNTKSDKKPDDKIIITIRNGKVTKDLYDFVKYKMDIDIKVIKPIPAFTDDKFEDRKRICIEELKPIYTEFFADVLKGGVNKFSLSPEKLEKAKAETRKLEIENYPLILFQKLFSTGLPITVDDKKEFVKYLKVALYFILTYKKQSIFDRLKH